MRGLRKNNSFHDASEGGSVNGRAPAPASGRGGKVSGFSRQNRGEGNGKSRVGLLPPPDRGEELVDPDLRLRFGPFDFPITCRPRP